MGHVTLFNQPQHATLSQVVSARAFIKESSLTSLVNHIVVVFFNLFQVVSPYYTYIEKFATLSPQPEQARQKGGNFTLQVLPETQRNLRCPRQLSS